MRSDNICFHGDIKEISCGYPVVSAAMTLYNIICGV